MDPIYGALGSCLAFLTFMSINSPGQAQVAADVRAPRASASESERDQGDAAEDSRDRHKADPPSAAGLFVNPLALYFGFYLVELDYSPKQPVSFNVDFGLYSHSKNGSDVMAFGGNFGPQFFLTRNEMMRGPYFFPRVGYFQASATAGASTANASLFGVGATVGYQWNWHPFALRLGGGVMYYSGTVNRSPSPVSGQPSADVSLQGANILGDLSIGYAD